MPCDTAVTPLLDEHCSVPIVRRRWRSPARKNAHRGLTQSREIRLGINPLATVDRVRKKISLRYDRASDSPVAARGSVMPGLGR